MNISTHMYSFIITFTMYRYPKIFKLCSPYTILHHTCILCIYLYISIIMYIYKKKIPYMLSPRHFFAKIVVLLCTYHIYILYLCLCSAVNVIISLKSTKEEFFFHIYVHNTYMCVCVII